MLVLVALANIADLATVVKGVRRAFLAEDGEILSLDGSDVCGIVFSPGRHEAPEARYGGDRATFEKGFGWRGKDRYGYEADTSISSGK